MNKRLSYLSVLVCFLALFIITQKLSAQSVVPDIQQKITPGIQQQTSEAQMKIYPVLWHQTSAEYRALCYQAFNIARMQLEKLLCMRYPGEKYAIVTDLDETIVDNSYSEAENIFKGKDYEASGWKEWVEKASATAIPGAVEFLQWAAANDVAIFYVSNRRVEDIPATVKNLKRLNLPYANDDHMLFLSDVSTKEPRRQAVAAGYNIVLLLGDNLNDFSVLFEKKGIPERKEAVDKLQQEWGRRFIVIPNSIYGEWENAVYDYTRKLTTYQKDSLRKSKLVTTP
jgi:5'-nucleotidase (lipoprotein e(P4) family)